MTAIASTAIQVAQQFDDGPVRWRIGLVALGTDFTAELDFAQMRPSDQVGLYVNRVPFANPTTRENLLRMQPHLAEAAALILPDERLDAIAYACTSASALIGDDQVRAALQQGKPGTPCVTPTSAALAAFAALGVSRVSVMAPYVQEVSEGLADYFASQGLDVLTLGYLGIADDRQIGKLTPQSVLESAVAATAPDAEGLFLSCTALRAAPLVQELEQRLGKVVITSNQAMVWQSLRAAGCTAPIAGYGRLLAEH